MITPVDPSILTALEREGRARVIVTFDHRPTHDDLVAYEVIFEFGSIRAAALWVDRHAFERLAADDSVLRIEPDGEVRALD
jgi:hypothetical protein